MAPLLLVLAGMVALGCRREPFPDAGAASDAGVEANNAVTTDSGLPPEPARVLIETKAMGTLVRVAAYSNPQVDESGVREAIASAFAEIRRLERRMSPHGEDSDLSRIHAHAGDKVRVSEETYEVIEKALWAGKLSGGAFDITFASMSDVWKFGSEADPEPKPPDPTVIAQRRRLVDYSRVELDAQRREVRIPAGRRIGLGGIAKGYAVDRAAAVLRKLGVRDFLLQAGGDMVAFGGKPGGEPWVTGLQDPRGPRDTPFATLALRDCAFSTAGDYERFYIADGKRYHHIIDPRTGYPATASRSVSVLAPSGIVADSVDDAVFVLGPEKGLSMVESLPGVGAVIVDRDNKVWISERLRGRVEVARPPTP